MPSICQIRNCAWRLKSSRDLTGYVPNLSPNVLIQMKVCLFETFGFIRWNARIWKSKGKFEFGKSIVGPLSPIWVSLKVSTKNAWISLGKSESCLPKTQLCTKNAEVSLDKLESCLQRHGLYPRGAGRYHRITWNLMSGSFYHSVTSIFTSILNWVGQITQASNPVSTFCNHRTRLSLIS